MLGFFSQLNVKVDTLTEVQMQTKMIALRVERGQLVLSHEEDIKTQSAELNFESINQFVRTHQEFLDKVTTEFSSYSLSVVQADRVNEFSKESKAIFQKCMNALTASLRKDGDNNLANYVNTKSDLYSCGFSIAYSPQMNGSYVNRSMNVY